MGESIDYTYEVSNSGTVTLAGTVTIEDDKIASGITCEAVPVGGLGPGGTVTCTGSYTTTQADVDVSAVVNTATATLAGVQSSEETERVTWISTQAGQPTVELGVGAVSVVETAGSLRFGVRLSAASEQTVTVEYETADATATAGSDYTAAAVDSVLTFTAGTTVGTIEVAIADDKLDEEDETFTVRLRDAVNATLGAVATATATIVDDDDRGVTVSPTKLEVTEGGRETYTVVLRSEPTGDVTVEMAASGDEDVTVSPESLTFTDSNWATGQTVTVSADGDVDADDDAAEITHTVGGGDYADESAEPVTVTVADDETASTTVTLSVEPASVAEEVSEREITVTGTLDQAPRAQATAVTVSVAGDTATAAVDFAAVADFELTIAAGELSGAETFTLAPVNDDVDEADETVTVSGAVADAAAGLTVTEAQVTITDNDDRGVTVSPTKLEVTEGGSDSYTVVLTSEPTDDVTVEMAVSGDEDVTVSPESLTFTDSNWETRRTVTVSADEDEDGDDDTAEITHTVGGGDYASESAKPVTVTVDDDETASTTVTLSVEPAAVAEEVGEREITVTGTLDQAPRAQATAVTVSVAGATATAPADFAAVADFELTIAAGELSGAETFTLTPVNDDVDEADETVTVSGAVADAAAGLTVTEAQVTITDNDDRGVTVSPTKLEVTEGSSDSYMVALTSQPTDDVTVTVSVPGGTDVSVDEDPLRFTSTTWKEAQTVTVRVAEDDDALADETVTLTHDVRGGDYGANGVTAEPVEVVIIETDTPTLSVSDARAVEASGEMVFTVTLSQASSDEVVVEYATADGTAEAGSDYSGATGKLTFAAETTAAQEIRVSIADDTVDEAEEETFTVTLSDATNAALAGGVTTLTVTGTIEDDDDPAVTVAFDRGSYTATEGGSAATVTVRLSADPERTVEIPLTHTPGAGAGAGDYSGVSASVTFGSGETERMLTLTATDDAVDEEDETVTLGFGTLPERVTPGTQSTAILTLTDNDDRGVTVSPTKLEVTEGGSETYTVVLRSEPTDEVTVTVSVPAGTDVSVDEDPLRFTSTTWKEAQTVTVRVAEDDDALADETVTLTHDVRGGDYGANGVTAEPVEVVIIETDTPTLSVSDARAVEASGEMVFTVTLSQASSEEVVVEYATADGTAEAGSDYSATTGKLTFAAGTTATQEIRVSIADDTVDEAEEETFTVTLSGALNATLAGGGTTLSATGTIADDDDPAVTVAFDRSSYTATEGGSAATVTVRLSGDPERTVEIPLTHTPGTGAGAGDYSGMSASVTFGSGDTERMLTLTATDDAVDEEEETVTLGFGTLPERVTPGTQNTAILTLTDNDDRGVTVSPTTLEVTEGGSETYTVVLTSQPTDDVTVTVSVPGGTDVSVDEDPLRFTSTTWKEAQTVTVRVAEDDDALADETVTLTHDVRGGDYGANGVTAEPVEVVIIETDTPTLSVSDARAVEASGEMVFTVTLSQASSDEVVVAYGTADGTANEGSDYSEATGKLTFAAGTTATQEIRVSIADDTVDEAEEETFTVTLSGALNATLAGGGTTLSATGTIADDDDPAVTVAFDRSSYTATEGGSAATVTVRLSGDPERTVEIPLTHTPGAGAGAGDYSGMSASVTFGSGDTERMLTLTATDDAVDEEEETVTLGFGTLPERVTPGTQNTAILTLTDNDDRGVTVSPTTLEVTEGGSDSYTVVLTSEPTDDVTVAVNVPEGAEFTAAEEKLTFTSTNWEETQTVTVRAARDDDAVAATPERIEHDVTGGDYAGEAADAVAVTVLEADTANAELTLEFGAPAHTDTDSNGEVTLGDGLSYEASARNSGNVPLSNVTVSDERAGGAAKVCATLGIGESCEWSGSYQVTQADVDAGKVDNTVTATADEVTDQQAGQSTTVAQERELTLVKTAQAASFGAVGESIDYTYEVSNSGTVTLAGTVTIEDDKIASGITCEAVPAGGLGPGGTVTCTGSYTTKQADVDVSEVVNKATATLAGVQSSEETARVTWISTQAGQPTVELGVGAVAGEEAVGSLRFSVRLSAASEQTVTVEYETADATATAGSDYTAAAADSVLTFTAGATAGTIEVAIADDKLDEEDETFTVRLREPVNATLGAVATATATIVDDDDRGVTVSPTKLEVTEGGRETYTVVLRSEPTGDVTVEMAASGDEDVTVSPESLTFTDSNWATGQTVTVSADGDVDADDDAAEITHTVGGGDYADESAEPVTVTVADDETASTTVTLSVEPASVAEEVSEREITVTGTLDQAPRAQATAVTVSVAGDTATAAADFAAVADFELTIAAGELSGAETFTLAPVNDDVDEADETVTVSGAVADAAAGLTVTEAQVTITDNDDRGVTVSPTKLEVTEGGSDSYTVVLTSEPTDDVTVAVACRRR